MKSDIIDKLKLSYSDIFNTLIYSQTNLYIIMENYFELSKNELLEILWKQDKQIFKILKYSEKTRTARANLFSYLNEIERSYFNIYSDNKLNKKHIIEKNNAKECIRVFKNIIRTENETLTGFSALKILKELSKNERNVNTVSKGFLCEMIYLIKGINGESGIKSMHVKISEVHSEASQIRSKNLDIYASNMEKFMKRYRSGLDKVMIDEREKMKKKILKFFNASEKDWNNYKWQLQNIIKTYNVLNELVILSDEEKEGVLLAEKNNIPFQITPYYLSLFNESGKTFNDKAVRAQVLPSKHYCTQVIKSKTENFDMDFMGEKSTSPVNCITRRYPQIVILKPYNSCPQICVYCQRNWEIESIENTSIPLSQVDNAIKWIKNNPNVSEVLVTGGDPLTLSDEYLQKIIDKICEIKTVERIRIGSRATATFPMRITDNLINIIKKYHIFGKREISFITHFEHSTEITPDVLEAVKKIKYAGISIYNQQVFTYYNSLRFETCELRRLLKLSGIDPYYSFNTKGKEETTDFRVPIARIEQERKEEARFMPGLVRTDEPVFNVPKLGKSHLRSWQDHEPVMVNSKGERIYRFYPWESRVNLVDDYLYKDVSIFDYLHKLYKDGETISDYQTIWYYF